MQSSRAKSKALQRKNTKSQMFQSFMTKGLRKFPKVKPTTRIPAIVPLPLQKSRKYTLVKDDTRRFQWLSQCSLSCL
jgi:hypothetical protein